MPANHLNPNVPNVAARYVAKAMTRVHPSQRSELLREMIAMAELGIATAAGERRSPVRAPDFSVAGLV